MGKLKGFTLLDLVIVMAIAGIFAAIGIPAYQVYIREKSDHACMLEAEKYAKEVLNALHAGYRTKVPVLVACSHIDSAETMTTQTLGVIQAKSVVSDGRLIECDLAKAGVCK